MSVALPVQVPDFRALGVHAHALADGLTGCANLPAFNDPNITTKLEKLDTVTRDIDNLKRDLITSITEALTEALTEVIDKKFDAFTKKIDDVKQEVGAVKQEVGAVKQEVSAVKQGLGAVEKRLDAVEKRLGAVEQKVGSVEKRLDAVEKRLGAVEQKVGSVERNLSTSIAAREMNGLVRTKNRRSSKLEPLHSVFTNEPIANFPQSIAQFKRLNNTRVAQILEYLDDPFHKPNFGSLLEKRERLALLAGVSLSSPDRFVMRPAADAGAPAADADADDAADDDDDDE